MPLCMPNRDESPRRCRCRRISKRCTAAAPERRGPLGSEIRSDRAEYGPLAAPIPATGERHLPLRDGIHRRRRCRPGWRVILWQGNLAQDGEDFRLQTLDSKLQLQHLLESGARSLKPRAPSLVPAVPSWSLRGEILRKMAIPGASAPGNGLIRALGNRI